jgi:hypothetical protein
MHDTLGALLSVGRILFSLPSYVIVLLFTWFLQHLFSVTFSQNGEANFVSVHSNGENVSLFLHHLPLLILLLTKLGQ